MTVESFLVEPSHLDEVPLLEPVLDVFAAPDLLAETQLMDVRSLVVPGRAACLIDMKGSLSFRGDGNVGLILCEGVRAVSWQVVPQGSDRFAWTILSSSCTEDDDALHVNLGCTPDGDADLYGRRFTFVLGEMPGMDDAPPDYTEATDAEIWAGNPTWDKPFTPLAVARRTVGA